MGQPFDKQQLHRHRQRLGKEFKLAAMAMLKGGQKPGTHMSLELGVARILLC